MKTPPNHKGQPLLKLIFRSIFGKMLPKPEAYPIRYYKKGRKVFTNEQELIN